MRKICQKQFPKIFVIFYCISPHIATATLWTKIKKNSDNLPFLSFIYLYLGFLPPPFPPEGSTMKMHDGNHIWVYCTCSTIFGYLISTTEQARLSQKFSWSRFKQQGWIQQFSKFFLGRGSFCLAECGHQKKTLGGVCFNYNLYLCLSIFRIRISCNIFNFKIVIPKLRIETEIAKYNLAR